MIGQFQDLVVNTTAYEIWHYVEINFPPVQNGAKESDQGWLHCDCKDGCHTDTGANSDVC